MGRAVQVRVLVGVTEVPVAPVRYLTAHRHQVQVGVRRRTSPSVSCAIVRIHPSPMQAVRVAEEAVTSPIWHLCRVHVYCGRVDGRGL